MSESDNHSAVPPAPTALRISGAADSGIGGYFERANWLSFGITGLALILVYCCTLAPEVTLQFSGVLSTSAMYGGVGYPPGFPVWTVYSWFFVNL
ncbi:MAG: hypothetical protein ACREIC_15595, partial [Limisphaerales bacterium]